MTRQFVGLATYFEREDHCDPDDVRTNLKDAGVQESQEALYGNSEEQLSNVCMSYSMSGALGMKTKSMSGKKPFFWHKIVDIYRQVFSVLKKDPTICFLFGVLAAIELVTLYFLYGAPSSDFLSPIVRRFWGDEFLHYPANFLLLPKLFQHAHFAIMTIVGIVISGVTIKKIESLLVFDKQVSIVKAVNSVFRKYIGLITIWLISYGALAVTMKLIVPAVPQRLRFILLVSFILGLGVQALVAFLIPALLISGKGFFQSVVSGFRLAIENFMAVVGILFVPLVVLAVFSYVKFSTPQFVIGSYPEIVLWVMVIGIGVITVVDLLITVSTTLLYLKVKDEK